MIPAGLKDKSIEVFVIDGDPMIFSGGNMIKLTDSIDAMTMVREDLDKRPFAIMSYEVAGITDPVEQILQHAICMYGDFNTKVDITPDGISNPEYWDCGQRGSCPYEGTRCLLPSGPNGTLTPREIEVIKLIAQDLADKQIAEKLAICENTVHKHRDNRLDIYRDRLAENVYGHNRGE